MQNSHAEIHGSGRTVSPSTILELSSLRAAGVSITIGPSGRRKAGATEQLSAQLAHDARNLISAFELSCELLASPGVLAPGFGHYAGDLRQLAASAARLIEELVASRAVSPRDASSPGMNPRWTKGASLARGAGIAREARLAGAARTQGGGRPVNALEADPVALRRRPFPEIEDLAEELRALEGPLRALAGREVHLEIECLPCAGRLALNSEDLLRILFNLVAHAVEAMAMTPAELRRRPSLRITAQRGGAASFLELHGQPSAESVVLAVRDNGPGIAAEDLARVFDSGFTTRRGRGGAGKGESGPAQRGLGLAIVRHLVASAGGAVRAVSPAGFGSRFDIELPVVCQRFEDFQPPSGQVQRALPHLQQISAQIEKEA